MLIARVIVAMAWILGAGSLLLFGSFLWTGGGVGLEFSFTPLSALLWDAEKVPSPFQRLQEERNPRNACVATLLR